MKLNKRIEYVKQYNVSNRFDSSEKKIMYFDWNEPCTQIHPQVLSDIMASIKSSILAAYPDTECKELIKRNLKVQP